MPGKRKQTKRQEKKQENTSDTEIETQESPDEETTAEINLPTDQLQVVDAVNDGQDIETSGNLRIYIAEPLPASSSMTNISKTTRSATNSQDQENEEIAKNGNAISENTQKIRAEGPQGTSNASTAKEQPRQNINERIAAIQREYDENCNTNRPGYSGQSFSEIYDEREYRNRHETPPCVVNTSRSPTRCLRQSCTPGTSSRDYRPARFSRSTDFTSSLPENFYMEPHRVQTRHTGDQLTSYPKMNDRVTVSGANLKLPAFTGNDDWKVWISRFEAIAQRRNWTDEEKLDEILPRLQGGAGEFVFTQLPKTTLNNYTELVKELGYRYRIIENTKSYISQFANRSQKSGEMIEEYAAELKRLHHKAYPKRDRNQRRDDLLERFMRGILDEEVRFFVNYMKKPTDIDEAVYAVVECMSERQSSKYKEPYSERKMKKHIRRTSPFGEEYEGDTECDTEEEIEETILRLKSHQKQKQEQKKNENANECENRDKGMKSEVSNTLKCSSGTESKSLIQQLQERISILEKQVQEGRPDEKRKSITCYNCNKLGHISRNCRAPKNNKNNQGYMKNLSRSKGQQQASIDLNYRGQPQLASREPY